MPLRVGGGQLQRPALVVAPAAQVGRRPVLRLDLHAHDVDEERAGSPRRAGVNSSTGPRCASSLMRPRRRRAARRARRRARPPGASRAWRASLASRAQRRLEHLLGALGGDHGGAVGVEHDEVAGPDLRAADDARARRARRRSSLVAPRERIQRAHTGRPISASSSLSRTAASTRTAAAPRTCAWVASRSPSSATGAGSGIVSTSTSPGCSARHHGVDHQVVVLPAARDPRRPAGARAGDDLAAARRRPGPGGRTPRRRSRRRAGRARGDAHSSSTTCGRTRMNDSP